VPLVLTFNRRSTSFCTNRKAANLGTKVSGKTFTYAVSPRIGFYDGMFGPGTGLFHPGHVMCGRAKLIAATATGINR